MDKKPVFYTDAQEAEIQEFINDQWGGKSGYISHEIQSEYVHTDISINENEEDGTFTFVTFGMGARKMNCPFPDYSRTELLMFSSPEMKNGSESNPNLKQLIACGQLTRLSKYPFANDTWIGPGHTINATDKFRETFGYEFFLFLEYNQSPELSKIGKVRFLMAVPVYEDERDWIVTHRDGSQRFIDAYFDFFDDEGNGMCWIDIPREHIVMDDAEDDTDDEEDMEFDFDFGEYEDDDEDDGWGHHRRPYMMIENGTLYKYIPDEDGECVIPDGVETIASRIFSWDGIPEDKYDDWETENEMYVSSLHIPASVKKIEGGAFSDAVHIEEISVNPDCEAAVLHDGVLYSRDMTKLLFCSESMSNGRDLVVPDGVKVIEKGACTGCDFNSVKLPESLKIIEDCAFQYCSRMRKINIPDSVEQLGEDVFAGCDPLDIEVSENSKVLTVNSTGVFSKDGSTLMIMFDNGTGDYVVPEGVTEIEFGAFSKIQNLRSVVIPEGVNFIQGSTFFWEFSLEKVVLPESVDHIGQDAFCSCNKLREINLSKNIGFIEPYAFNGCESLEEIELPGTGLYIGENAFLNCNKLVIKAPAGSFAIKYCQENGIKYIEI